MTYFHEIVNKTIHTEFRKFHICNNYFTYYINYFVAKRNRALKFPADPPQSCRPVPGQCYIEMFKFKENNYQV